MKNKIKLSVGIPAFNEEANIKNLLISILSQVEKDYSLLEIIVISDGSTDNTATLVSEINNSKIKLIDCAAREGKSRRINQIINKFEGDALFLIDADIKIKDKALFTKLIGNNDLNQSGLIGINAVPEKAVTGFQKIINAGVLASLQISSLWNKGQNYLSFRGSFLGVSREFAKQVNLDPTIVNNDAYFYFKAQSLGYNPSFHKNLFVYYKSPRNYTDHLNQSKRFKSSKDEMQKIFNKDLKAEYTVPNSIYIKVALTNLVKNPILFSSYLFIKTLTSLAKRREIKSTWNIAVSTK